MSFQQSNQCSPKNDSDHSDQKENYTHHQTYDKIEFDSFTLSQRSDIKKSNQKSQKTLEKQKHLECTYKQAQIQISQLKQENCSMNQLTCQLLQNGSERMNYQDNIDKIESMLSTLKEENNFLKNQNLQAVQLNQKLKQDEEKMRMEMRGLQEENKSLLYENGQQKIQIEQILVSLEKVKQEKLQEIKQQISMQNQLRKEIKAESVQNAQLQEENNELQGQLNQIQSVLNNQKEMFNEQQRTISSLQNEFQSTQQEKARLQQMVKGKEKEMKDITEKVNLLCHQQQKLNEMNEINEGKIGEYERVMEKLGQIYNLSCEDGQSVEKMLGKVQSIEETNGQIKQRIKVLAEVISKQDKNYKARMSRIQAVLEEKEKSVSELVQEKEYSCKVIQELQGRYDEASKNLKECCCALKQVSVQCDDLKQECHALQQDKMASQFFISNLTQHVFQPESLEAIHEAQNTYQQILELQGLLGNWDQFKSNKENIRHYESQLVSCQKQLQTQLDDLRELRTLDFQRYKAALTQKQALIPSSEIDLLKPKKSASVHNDTFGHSASKQASHCSSSLNNYQNRENKFSHSNQAKTEYSLPHKPKQTAHTQSLLGQFFSIRKNNSALSHQK